MLKTRRIALGTILALVIGIASFAAVTVALPTTADAQTKTYQVRVREEANRYAAYSLDIMIEYQMSEGESYDHRQPGVPEPMLDEVTLRQWRILQEKHRLHQYWMWRYNVMQDRVRKISGILEEWAEDTQDMGARQRSLIQTHAQASREAYATVKSKIQTKARSFGNPDMYKRFSKAIEKIKEEHGDVAETEEVNGYVAWLNWEGKFITIGKYVGYKDETDRIILENTKGKEIEVKDILWIEDQRYLYGLLRQMRKPIPPMIEHWIENKRFN